MKSNFISWFLYNRDANQQFIDIFESENHLSPSSIALFSHILNTHLIWLNRIHMLTNTSVPGIWEEQSIAHFDSLNRCCYEKTQEFLQVDDNEMELNNVITYKNSKGKAYENALEEIYFHILMHSMYHRGQIAKLFRKSDLEPPITDFIFHMRDKRMEREL
jgi:uncharacterized damage-inducible protein DinB